MIKIWMHQMFLRDSQKEESDLTLETEKEITLYELLDKVCEGDDRLRFKLLDEQKNLRPHVNIFIGSKNTRNLNGIETLVSANDEVSIFPSLSGG
ncbi:MAG: MoaD/ThiS family protein [Pyrinomonadaceae bacterium]